MSKTNQTITVPVLGMHCASCASIVQRKLSKLDGITECSINYGTEKANITFDPKTTSVAAMNDEIDKLGYSLLDTNPQPQPTPKHDHEMATGMTSTPAPSSKSNHTRMSEMTMTSSNAGMDHSLHAGHDMMTPISSDQQVKARKLAELEKLRSQLQIVLPFVAVSILVMSWEVAASPFKLVPEMPEMVMEFFHHLIPLFATYTLFVVGIPYLQGVSRFIKYRVANMDTLVGIGTLVAFLYSFVLAAFAAPLSSFVQTNQSYYDVTIVVIGFITLGKYLESRSKLKTGEAIEKLLGLQAKTALVLRNGVEVEIAIEDVLINDVVIIKPGQKIPVDGEIILGSSAIDESMITGESIPVDKKVGDTVIGATINKHGSLQVKATQVGTQTVLSQIIAMVEQAQGSKAPIERLADQISAVFVPVVLVIAVGVLATWLIIGSQFMPFSHAFSLGITSFVGILVIACPCAMGLATPTAVIVGVGKAAANGILIKNAENLEKFNSIDYVIMDKTGTITKGQPEVTDITPVGKNSAQEVLTIIASLEKHSEHPLATAVVARAQQEKLTLATVNDFSAIEGKGLSGKIGSKEYTVGNVRLAEELAATVDPAIITAFAKQGKTPIVLLHKKSVLAYLAIADTVKDDAKSTVAKLHQQGIKVAMVTGDNKQTAQHIADQVGIDTILAEVLPADKAAEVTKLQAQGYKVAMVGDGINDAPALASSDVGVAMGTGTDVAIESAGITLLGGNISKLPKAVTLARATMSTVKQNLFWAFFYNIIGIPIAAGLLYPFLGILLNPAIAGAAMAFSSVSVVLNALRLKTVQL